jgi:hypothetical protein
VLNCAAKGCPPLQAVPLSAAAIETQLDEATRTWVRKGAYQRDGRTLTLSMLFDWYAADFEGDSSSAAKGDKGAAAVRFLVRFVDEEEAAALKAGDFSVKWLPYDWTLNRVE